MNKKTLIIVDSSTTITKEIATKYDIKILPLALYRDDNKAYISDALDITPNQLLEMADNGYKFKTGCTPLGMIENEIENSFKDYENIIALTISKKWSSQYEHFYSLSLKEEYKNRLFVVDTLEWGYNTEWLAIDLREKINSGLYTIKELIEYANNFHKYTVSFFLCRSLNGLVDSGRVPKIIAKLMKFTKIYPLIKVENGENHLEAMIKNLSESINKIIKSIYKSYNNVLDEKEIVKIAIITACNSDIYIEEVKNSIIKALKIPSEKIIVRPAPNIFINIVSRDAIGVNIISTKEKKQ